MNNNDWTPEELELKEALNKAYENSTYEPSKPLDLSFMDEPQKKKSSKTRRRLAYIAAIIAVAFVSSFVTLVVSSNDYVSAAKESIQRKVFEMNNGVVVATDEEFAEEGETVWEITDFETVKKAKKLVPELPIPGYVPEGYEFEVLVLQLYNDKYVANYNFINQNEHLIISCQTYNGDFDFSLFHTIETMNYDDRTITTWEDHLSSTLGAHILIHDSIVILTATDNSLSNDQILLIATDIL